MPYMADSHHTSSRIASLSNFDVKPNSLASAPTPEQALFLVWKKARTEGARRPEPVPNQAVQRDGVQNGHVVHISAGNV